MDRRAQKFQFQVQQRLNLADDELARLDTYKQSLEGDISALSDQLRRFKSHANYRMSQSQGKQKLGVSQHNVVLSHMKSEHAVRLTDIEHAHNDEVAKYQDDFQRTLEEVEQWGDDAIRRETSEIESRIERTTQAIEKTKSIESVVQDESERYERESGQKTMKFDVGRIKRLEAALKQKTQDRLAVLNGLKDRLAESIGTLEDLERDHASKMNSLTGNLEAADRAYEKKTTAMREKHEKEMRTTKNRLNGIVARRKILEKSMAQASRQAQLEMENVQVNTSELRTQADLVREATKASVSDTTSMDIATTSKSLKDAKTELADRENRLLQMRVDNENMKREVARLKHEKIMQARIMSLRRPQ